MNTQQPVNAPVQAPRYQICVQEMLDSTWVDWFDGLSITPLPGGSTLLSGPVVDQAALNGLLNKIHHLNLTLISVKRIGVEEHVRSEVPPVSGETQ